MMFWSLIWINMWYQSCSFRQWLMMSYRVLQLTYDWSTWDYLCIISKCTHIRQRKKRRNNVCRRNICVVMSGLLKGAQPSPSSCTLFHQPHNNWRLSYQKGPICHASAWRVEPFWQETLQLHPTPYTPPTRAVSICSLTCLSVFCK